MSEEGKVLSLGIVSILVFLVSLILVSSWEGITESKMFIEAGYEQKVLPGEDGVYWVKSKPQAEIEGHDVGN